MILFQNSLSKIGTLSNNDVHAFLEATSTLLDSTCASDGL